MSKDVIESPQIGKITTKFLNLVPRQQNLIALKLCVSKDLDKLSPQYVPDEILRRIRKVKKIDQLAILLKLKKPAVKPPKCVQIRFQGIPTHHTREYSYLTYLNFKRNDYATVVTPAGKLEVVVITGFDQTFWHQNPYKCKWIVSKVDLKAYEKNHAIPKDVLIEATRDHPMRATAIFEE